MEIKIPLPISSSANTYDGLKGYLKQLELAVHHAQKSVESAEKNGIVITDSCHINFQHPHLHEKLIYDSDQGNLSENEKNFLREFTGMYYDLLQDISLVVYLK